MGRGNKDPGTPARYTVGGTVTGLTGTGLFLRNNGGDSLTVSANGAFTFATPVASGAGYAVTVFTQPTSPSQTCTVTGGSGTVGGGNVTSVSVACTTNTYTVGGTVDGLAGTGLVLRNNGGDSLPVSGNGAFAFTTPVASGTGYAVTVFAQPTSPSQTCTVTDGSGTVGSGNVSTVAVTCASTALFAVGGTVTGLTRTGLVLNNGADDLPVNADGVFAFATEVAEGAAYAVTVKTQPSAGTCSVANGSGNVAGADVTNVAVTCHGWTVPVRVDTLAGHASVAELAFDASGDGIAVWYQRDVATNTNHIHSARYSGANGTWGAPTRLDSASTSAAYHHVAVDGDGNAIAVWTQKDGSDTSHLWASRYPVGGPWGAAEQIDSGTQEARFPKVAFDGDGNALVVWQLVSGGTSTIASLRYTPGGGWDDVMHPRRLERCRRRLQRAPGLRRGRKRILHLASDRWLALQHLGEPVDAGTRLGNGGAPRGGPDGTRLFPRDRRGPGRKRHRDLAPGRRRKRLHPDEPGLRRALGRGGIGVERPPRGRLLGDFDEVPQHRDGQRWERLRGLDVRDGIRYLREPLRRGHRDLERAGAHRSQRRSVRQAVLHRRRWSRQRRRGLLWASRYVNGLGWEGALRVDSSTAAYASVVRYDASGNPPAVWVQTDGTGTYRVVSSAWR